jgi:endo-1,4-beta-mannosidase
MLQTQEDTDTQAPQPLQVGVNYWPRRKAMYWWKNFDAGEVREEFAHIASWGMQIVRICLLWEDFQPEVDQINPRALADLTTVLDVAGDNGLQVMATLFVGNMSGVIWFPSWVYTAGHTIGDGTYLASGQPTNQPLRDFYAEPAMLRAAAHLTRTVATQLCTHQALWGWDLANEIDAALAPSSDDAGWLWTAVLAGILRRHDPDHPVTYGAHPPSLEMRDHLQIDTIAPLLDLLSIHGYPLYSEVARAPLDPEFVPYVTALTAALGGKPAWMQEFGVCTTAPGQASRTITDDFLGRPKPQFLASEEDAAAYYDAVLTRLSALRVPAALAWCYADYTPDLWDRPPLDRAIRERTFGLVRADGSEKPAVAVIKRHIAAPSPPQIPVPDVLDGLSPDAYFQDPGRHFQECYTRWLHHAHLHA